MCNVPDIIFDSAKRLGITEKALFRRIAKDRNLTEATADDRYERWFKRGETPDYITDWCLDLYREPFPLDASRIVSS